MVRFTATRVGCMTFQCLRSPAEKHGINKKRVVLHQPPGYLVPTMDWQQQLGFLLDDVAHLYARRFNEHARGLSLTLHQCKALAVLANCEGINQTRLAETSDIFSNNLVRILNRLETGGWVKRSTDPHDRRAHVLLTTQSAKPVVQDIWRAVSKANAEALKGLAIRDLPVLMELLARVHANLVALEPLHSVVPGLPAPRESEGL